MSVPGTVRRSLSESIRLAGERLRRAPRRIFATWLVQALVLLVLGWLAYLPFSKLWHIFSGILALMFRSSRHRGAIAKDPDVAAMLNDEEIDEEGNDGVRSRSVQIDF